MERTYFIDKNDGLYLVKNNHGEFVPLSPPGSDERIVLYQRAQDPAEDSGSGLGKLLLIAMPLLAVAGAALYLLRQPQKRQQLVDQGKQLAEQAKDKANEAKQKLAERKENKQQNNHEAPERVHLEPAPPVVVVGTAPVTSMPEGPGELPLPTPTPSQPDDAGRITPIREVNDNKRRN